MNILCAVTITRISLAICLFVFHLKNRWSGHPTSSRTNAPADGRSQHFSGAITRIRGECQLLSLARAEQKDVANLIYTRREKTRAKRDIKKAASLGERKGIYCIEETESGSRKSKEAPSSLVAGARVKREEEQCSQRIRDSVFGGQLRPWGVVGGLFQRVLIYTAIHAHRITWLLFSTTLARDGARASGGEKVQER